MSRRSIDAVVLYPLPVLLIQLRPFGPELQAAIASLDVIDPLASSCDTCGNVCL
jgi:hypothetical protein